MLSMLARHGPSLQLQCDLGDDTGVIGPCPTGAGNLGFLSVVPDTIQPHIECSDAS